MKQILWFGRSPFPYREIIMQMKCKAGKFSAWRFITGELAAEVPYEVALYTFDVDPNVVLAEGMFCRTSDGSSWRYR